jgi:glycogen debranching enzyme
MATHESPLPNLLPGEEIVRVEQAAHRKLRDMPTDIDALLRLAQAKQPAQVGGFGPVLASIALKGRGKDPDYHRYETIFGRDSLRTAIDLVGDFPALAHVTLVKLAETQGIAINRASEEEPGRIAHEIRDPATDLVAQRLTAERGWEWPYYGSVDATPEFIRTLAAYCRSTHESFAFLKHTYVGRDNVLHTMRDAFEAAVAWIERRCDANRDGLLEFKRSNPQGLENQAWKDSWDAYFHRDGTIANHHYGIASVEVQRVAYDALCDAADIYKRMGEKARARDLRNRAARLQIAIMDLFWTDEHGGYFVLGTDRDSRGRLRQLRIRTSNMGHLLHSRLLAGGEPEIQRRREAVITQLFSPDMLGLNGIRTLASDEVRYRPGAYHNGSIWIWDNYMIASGLDTLGYHGLAKLLNDKLLDDVAATRRFPEYLRGDNNPTYRLNTRTIEVRDTVNKRTELLEQPPQDIQAWTVAAILALKVHRSRGLQYTTDERKRAFEDRLIAAASYTPTKSRRQRRTPAVRRKIVL